MDQYIKKLQNRLDLSEKEIQQAMRLIVSGDVSNEAVSRFLLALNDKSPSIDEITGAAKILRSFSFEVSTRHRVVLDTCGTGGDKKNTFNISTIAAFVVAGAGVVLAKHGNRSVSSRCGSADVLEALGVNISMEKEYLGECLDKIGIAFLFAQQLHPAMKNVAPVRKRLGVETIFNLLGPLLNPAKATHQMMGVYNRDYVEPMAKVLKNLGLRRAFVVHGSDGLDEVTITGKTFVSEYNGRGIISYTLDPVELGFALGQESDLLGADVPVNAAIALDILKGARGPQRDIVILNAACALYCAEKVKDLSAGIVLAQRSLDQGKALQKLNDLKAFTHGIKL
ncbi:MAG: anthranilate phosphoribosyltransferase [Candidatus Omnitrophica bacterium]|nr:anthranilate phosphoribosyltransferase [Candidatus Omnitrophota bacterium]